MSKYLVSCLVFTFLLASPGFVGSLKADACSDAVTGLSPAVTGLLAEYPGIRLVGAPGVPKLGTTTPDAYESRSLDRAARGLKTTPKVEDGAFRTFIPLTFSTADGSAGCAGCHTGYTALVAGGGQVLVGGASFSAPVGKGSIKEIKELQKTLLEAVTLVTEAVADACGL